MKNGVVAIGALLIGMPAAAQTSPTANFGSQPGAVAPPSDAASDPPGSSGGWGRKFDANGHMNESEYRALLAGQIAAAQALTGKPLTDRDRGRIRSAIQGDLIAWRRQYDPRRAHYRAMRERWLVDEKALSAEGWAKQRLDWLRAQQQWILATGG